jgi:hypothetical protein
MTLAAIYLDEFGFLVVRPFLDAEPSGRRRDGEEAAIFFWLRFGKFDRSKRTSVDNEISGFVLFVRSLLADLALVVS